MKDVGTPQPLHSPNAVLVQNMSKSIVNKITCLVTLAQKDRATMKWNWVQVHFKIESPCC